MTLIYALVARNTVILAEQSSSTGNFSSIAQQLLSKISPQDSKLTLVYDDYLFHYIQANGITFMCMANSSFGRRIPFMFLEDISRRFMTLYGTRAQTAIAYGLYEFKTVLEQQMVYYSTSETVDKFKQVQGEIETVKDVMVKNIEKVLERGERIEILVDKTDSLNQASFVFKKRSTALRRAMWWKNQKLIVVMVTGGILVFYLFIGSICGLPGWSSCSM